MNPSQKRVRSMVSYKIQKFQRIFYLIIIIYSDKDLNDNPAPKIVTRSHRSAAQKIPKYVFSEDENSENMSDTGMFHFFEYIIIHNRFLSKNPLQIFKFFSQSGEQKKPKSVFKPKTAVKSRNQATKKSDKKRNLSDDEEKLNLNSARSDQEDAYSVFGYFKIFSLT